jgi:hypothetical protein
VCFRANAKNRFGAYTGQQVTGILFANGSRHNARHGSTGTSRVPLQGREVSAFRRLAHSGVRRRVGRQRRLAGRYRWCAAFSARSGGTPKIRTH